MNSFITKVVLEHKCGVNVFKMEFLKLIANLPKRHIIILKHNLSQNTTYLCGIKGMCSYFMCTKCDSNSPSVSLMQMVGTEGLTVTSSLPEDSVKLSTKHS